MLPGVVRTAVGYSGGQTHAPTYHNMGDHTESLQIEYDPQKTSFEDILAVFWREHEPAFNASGQYMNAVFYHNDKQRELALGSKERLQAKTGTLVKTEVLPVRSFTLAEDYHQKYYLQGQRDLVKNLNNFAVKKDLIRSPLMARLNGYCGTSDNFDRLQLEIDSFGLTDKARAILERIVKQRDSKYS
jgi:peptide-methionine (S)-S-oxide reductase